MYLQTDGYPEYRNEMSSLESRIFIYDPVHPSPVDPDFRIFRELGCWLLLCYPRYYCLLQCWLYLFWLRFGYYTMNYTSLLNVLMLKTMTRFTSWDTSMQRFEEIIDKIIAVSAFIYLYMCHATWQELCMLSSASLLDMLSTCQLDRALN